jgi:predicted nucleic acid-binding Zn ribbon protein
VPPPNGKETSDQPNGALCAICKEKTSSLNNNLLLNCGHSLHVKCLVLRLREVRVFPTELLSCPICAKAIQTNNKGMAEVIERLRDKQANADMIIKMFMKNRPDSENEKDFMAVLCKCQEGFQVVSKNRINHEAKCNNCYLKEQGAKIFQEHVKKGVPGKELTLKKELMCKKHALENQAFKCWFCCDQAVVFLEKNELLVCEKCKESINKNQNYPMNGPFKKCDPKKCFLQGKHPENGYGNCLFVCYGCMDNPK